MSLHRSGARQAAKWHLERGQKFQQTDHRGSSFRQGDVENAGAATNRFLRNATGDNAASHANPLPLAVGAGQGLVRYSDNQEEIKSIRENAIDGYVAQREVYKSYREAQIRNAAPVPRPMIELAKNADDDKQETKR